jgi:uncharacterized protein YodC (DUF2158 family)
LTEKTEAQEAQAETMFVQRLQALVDRAAVTANDMAGKAVSRVIEERDSFTRIITASKEDARITASLIQKNVEQVAKLAKDRAVIKSEFNELRDAVSHFQRLVGLLTADANEMNEVIGQVVQLKSGGIHMTAAGLDESGAILCVWMVDGDSNLYKSGIALAALRIVSKLP